jgi:hypothetical protein
VASSLHEAAEQIVAVEKARAVWHALGQERTANWDAQWALCVGARPSSVTFWGEC